MPYDPRMMQQIGRMGIGMMGPQQSSDPFQAAPRPKQWWEGLPSMPAQKPDDPNAPAGAGGKGPPSLLDMMMGLGRMTRPEYDKAIAGPGANGIAPRDAAMVSPWAFLGSLGAGK
jgi:hypothetical protein